MKDDNEFDPPDDGPGDPDDAKAMNLERLMNEMLEKMGIGGHIEAHKVGGEKCPGCGQVHGPEKVLNIDDLIWGYRKYGTGEMRELKPSLEASDEIAADMELRMAEYPDSAYKRAGRWLTEAMRDIHRASLEFLQAEERGSYNECINLLKSIAGGFTFCLEKGKEAQTPSAAELERMFNMEPPDKIQ